MNCISNNNLYFSGKYALQGEEHLVGLALSKISRNGRHLKIESCRISLENDQDVVVITTGKDADVLKKSKKDGQTFIHTIQESMRTGKENFLSNFFKKIFGDVNDIQVVANDSLKDFASGIIDINPENGEIIQRKSRKPIKTGLPALKGKSSAKPNAAKGKMHRDFPTYYQMKFGPSTIDDRGRLASYIFPDGVKAEYYYIRNTDDLFFVKYSDGVVEAMDAEVDLESQTITTEGLDCKQIFDFDGNLLESIYANRLHILHSKDGGIESMNCPDKSIVECK